ncbi:MAG TPA: nucleotidyltransferase domain-containing protein [Phycisphaerae bacterium]|nr:nucleotidyltransferase domain-containing protein [Phycisphaerae bacterium]
MNPNMILGPGTKVVTKVEISPIGGGDRCPVGIVGIIVASPADNEHAYRVRCASGVEALVRRNEIEILSHFQNTGLHRIEGGITEYGLSSHIIYRCVIGSRAYGLDVEGSDIDRRGIYIAPSDMHWSLYGVPEQLENHETQECYWEIQKFLTLALKANPNILECLYTPIVEHANPLAQELLAMRGVFLSKLVYQTYNGYVLSQFKKMNSDIRNKGSVKPKHAMHLIRLLLSGIQILREGFVPVSVDAHRSKLLAIRENDVTWEQVNIWRKELHAEFDVAFASTSLPDRPDYERTNDFLIRVRREMVNSDE